MKKGFTLIELLVVLAIIGIITTLAIVSLNGARQRARDVKRWADVRSIQSAVEVCINEGGSPPTVPATWNGLLTQSCGGGQQFGSLLATGAMPIPPQTGCGENDVENTDCYMYCMSAGSYILFSNYEGTAPSGGLDGDITSYPTPATDCILSNDQRPDPLPRCSPIDGGTFCLGKL
ncbi:MAG: type II secretion system protein [Patescibacteria group bacterium]|nr:type II secretion system protein [Patescibacteria group bacterium]